ncbi:universal stress protein [Cellulomonas sp. JZ18]|uniref:universal stress protein n=1 Tax=Cellulomonas sp. JZ18 TaxID=2654191 RepID=UPI0012D40050|nr:universal stress protein [Cellulomonas sp. JZ18]QGQ19435.1 universal stress protein [Cellulomonas sp. JZ18]
MDAIVVAVGGSAADTVLDWAAAEARDLGRPLTAVHVRHGRREADEAAAGADLADRLAAACARAGADVATSVRVTSAEHVADAVTALDAHMLVLGRRARRRAPGRTTTAVLERARVPVTVVPHGEDDRAAPGGPVVVGVDGSRHACDALRHGADVAARRGVALEAVLAWQITTLAPLPGKEWGYVPPLDDYERHAARLLDEVVTHSGVTLPEGRLVRTLVHAPPGRALLDAATRAERLVVGHRGLTGLDRVLLGSVSRDLVAHAPCPVTVTR